MNPDIYSIGQVAEIVAGQLQKGRNYSECQIKHLLTDSRKIIDAESSLFLIALLQQQMRVLYIPLKL